MTLDEFIRSSAVRNSYVQEPGFKSLYVRIGARYIQSKVYSPVLDIAAIEARRKGKGAFTARNLIRPLVIFYLVIGATMPDVPEFPAATLYAINQGQIDFVEAMNHLELELIRFELKSNHSFRPRFYPEVEKIIEKLTQDVGRLVLTIQCVRLCAEKSHKL